MKKKTAAQAKISNSEANKSKKKEKGK